MIWNFKITERKYYKFVCQVKAGTSEGEENNYSQTKWSIPLKITLMNWLFEYWLH